MLRPWLYPWVFAVGTAHRILIMCLRPPFTKATASPFGYSPRIPTSAESADIVFVLILIFLFFVFMFAGETANDFLLDSPQEGRSNMWMPHMSWYMSKDMQWLLPPEVCLSKAWNGERLEMFKKELSGKNFDKFRRTNQEVFLFCFFDDKCR